MSVWVIADLHLSFGKDVPKPMDRFGSRWENHAEKIARRWNAVVRPGDTVVMPGDFSWADTLSEAEADFRFLDALPGKKLLGKGNHDYWWTGVTKMKAFLAERGFSTVDFLYNNAHAAEGLALAGSRGWFLEERQQTAIEADYGKLVRREAERLNLSLEAAEELRRKEGIGEPPLVFLHFPPVWGDFRLDELVDLMRAHGVTRCWYGHIHGQYSQPPSFEWKGITFANAAADYLNFTPLPVRI
ncbi:MAG: metallophosphoesterase [Clostridia bacterium]|nr:metallophosphoesterase [Clostridia bacterium]